MHLNFLTRLSLVALMLGFSVDEGRSSKMSPENELCDIKCFREEANPCSYKENCKCNIRSLNLTDPEIRHLPPPKLLCRDEDFIVTKRISSNEIYFLEISDEKQTLRTLPTRCDRYILAHLEPDSTYMVRFFTLNSDSQISGVSDFVEVKTIPKGIKPLPVSTLHVKELIPKDMHYEALLEWTPSEDLSCFYDFVWLSDNDMGDQTLRNPNQLFNMKIENLAFDTDYTVGIMAKHAYFEDESEKTWLEFHVPSCLDALGTVDICAPEQPANITVDQDVTDINPEGDNPLYNVKVTWAPPKFQPDYYIVILQDISPDTDRNNTHEELRISGDQTQCIFEGVEVGVLYHVLITAFSKGGKSEPASVMRHISGTRAAVVTLAKPASVLPIVLIVCSVFILILTLVLALVFYKRYRAKKAQQRQREEYFERYVVAMKKMLNLQSDWKESGDSDDTSSSNYLI